MWRWRAMSVSPCLGIERHPKHVQMLSQQRGSDRPKMSSSQQAHQPVLMWFSWYSAFPKWPLYCEMEETKGMTYSWQEGEDQVTPIRKTSVGLMLPMLISLNLSVLCGDFFIGLINKSGAESSQHVHFCSSWKCLFICSCMNRKWRNALMELFKIII